MESSLNPKTHFQSALQSRQQEQQRQAKFFKVAVPIALVFHGLAIGGLTMLAQRKVPEVAAEEVEIVVDNTTDQKDEPQPIDPNGQGGDLAGGGGGAAGAEVISSRYFRQTGARPMATILQHWAIHLRRLKHPQKSPLPFLKLRLKPRLPLKLFLRNPKKLNLRNLNPRSSNPHSLSLQKLNPKSPQKTPKPPQKWAN